MVAIVGFVLFFIIVFVKMGFWDSLITVIYLGVIGVVLFFIAVAVFGGGGHQPQQQGGRPAIVR